MIQKVVSDDEYYKAYSTLRYSVQNSKSTINAVRFHFWEEGETRPKDAVIKIIDLDAKSKAEVENLKNANVYEENTAKVYYSYSDSSHLNIVMEYCKNGSIANLIEAKKFSRSSWTESELTVLFISILKSVSNLHLHNFVHRDLKPSNLFFTSENIVKIGDFGESKHKTSEINTVKGTEIYMSPYLSKLYEDCKRNYLPIDELLIDPIKEDIWSLGKTFIEMALVTFLVFKQWTAEEICQKVKIELVNRKYSERFIELLLEMIADTRQSKRTAKEFLNDFRVLNGELLELPDVRTVLKGENCDDVSDDENEKEKNIISRETSQNFEEIKKNEEVKFEISRGMEETIKQNEIICNIEKHTSDTCGYQRLHPNFQVKTNPNKSLEKCGKCSKSYASVKLKCNHFYHDNCLNIIIADQLFTATKFTDVYCVCCLYPISIRHFKHYPCFQENPQKYDSLMNSRPQGGK